jgi:putative transposase
VEHQGKVFMGCDYNIDETSIKVKGQWRYLYRAVDKTGQTIDFLLTEERDEQAAKRFLTKAIRRHGVPEKITIDGSAANEAAIKSYNKDHGTAITIRKIKHLNNIVEQDHRGVKRITRPMLGFKAFDAAQSTLTRIELMHMLRKGQLAEGVEQGLTTTEQFYALAA